MAIVIPEIYHDSPGTSSSLAHAFQASQLLWNWTLASSRVATRSERHRAVDGQRPEPAQTVGTAAGLVDAAGIPLAGVDGVVTPILVDPGAEAGRAELRASLSSLTACWPFNDAMKGVRDIELLTMIWIYSALQSTSTKNRLALLIAGLRWIGIFGFALLSGYFVTQDAYLESTISILTVLAWIAATTEALDLVLERYS
jgi:hypothetical protein